MDIIKEYLVRLGFDLDTASFGAMKGIIDNATKHVQGGTATMAQGVDRIKGVIGGAMSGLSDAMGKVGGLFSGAGSKIHGALGTIAGGFSSMAGSVSQMAGRFTAPLAAMASSAGRVGGQVAGTFTSVGSTIEGATHKLTNMMGLSTAMTGGYGQIASQVASTAIKVQTSIVSAFTTMSGAAIGVVDKVAMADRGYALMGQKMLMTKEQAREMDMITKALGVDLADIQWNPELREEAIRMSQNMKRLSAQMGVDFDDQMKKVRTLHYAFDEVKMTGQFALMGFAQNLAKQFGIDDLTAKVRQWNAEISAQLPQITSKVAKYAKELITDTGEIFTHIGGALKSFGVLFTNVVGTITGDESLQGTEFEWEKLATAIGKTAGAIEKAAKATSIFISDETASIGQFGVAVNAYGSGISKYLDELNAKTQKAGDDTHKWAMDIIHQTAAALKSIGGPIISWIGEKGAAMMSWLGDHAAKVWGAVKTGWKDVTDTVGGWIDAFMNSKVGQLITKLVELLGIGEKLKGADKAFTGSAEATGNKVKQLGGFVSNVAKDIGQGVANFFTPSEGVKNQIMQDFAKGNVAMKRSVELDAAGSKAMADTFSGKGLAMQAPPEVAQAPAIEAARDVRPRVRVTIVPGGEDVRPTNLVTPGAASPPAVEVMQSAAPNRAQLLAGAMEGQAAPSQYGPMVTKLAATIRRIEGYNPNFAANNNPGNLTFAGQRGAVKGPGGFAKFPTLEAGEKNLEWQIQNYIDRGYDIRKFISTYAPPNTKNEAGGVQTNAATEAYIRGVEKELGITSGVALKSVQDTFNKTHPQVMQAPAPPVAPMRTGSRSIVMEPMSQVAKPTWADRAAAAAQSSAPDMRAASGGGGSVNQSVTINVPITFSGVDHGKVSSEVTAAIQRGADNAARRLQDSSNQRNLTQLAPQWG